MNETHTEPAGRQYWRSLNEYADSPELREKLSQEFPGYDPDELLGMSRRQFMKLAGASLALAGLTLTGCRRWPEQYLVPHNSRPEGTLPGVPQTYASMMQRGGVAQGLFVTTSDGRPISVAGSPLHPTSGDIKAYDASKTKPRYGTADTFALASILDLYDPDRSRSVVHRTAGKADSASWGAFADSFKFTNKRLAVLSTADDGPTFQDVKQRLLKDHPETTWVTWEPLARDEEIAGTRQAFGKPLRPVYDTTKAMVLGLFDSDLLTDHPNALAHARGWAKNRKSCDDGKMSRVYAVGPTLTPTTSNADEHIQVKPSVIADMLNVLAIKLGVSGVSGTIQLDDAEAKFIEHLAKDLKAHPGQSLITVGPNQPASVHTLAWAINEHVGAIGKTVTLVDDPAGAEPPSAAALSELVDQMKAGEIHALLILGGNPVYDAPANLGFADALAKVERSAHLSLYDNQTSAACEWHLPESHYLESWGDGRAWDGTLCLQQPMILPLYNGKSAIEVLAMMAHDDAAAGYDLVRRAWTDAIKADQYNVKAHAWAGTGEKTWRSAVHDGIVRDTAYPAVKASAGSARAASVSNKTDGFELVFRSDPKVYDGRYANNGWLQELPEPMTKVTWDNPALISVSDAQQLKLKNGDVVKVTANGRSLDVAVFLMPGQAPGTIVITLGQGQTISGRIAEGVGFNGYALRGSDSQTLGLAFDASVEKTGKRHALATTEEHHLIDPSKFGENLVGMDRRGTDGIAQKGLDTRVGKAGGAGILVKQATFAHYMTTKGRKFATDGAHGDVTLQLYDPPLKDYFNDRADAMKAANPEAVAEGWEPPAQYNEAHAWGMTIDMTACTGCSACVVACQSENNIPIVGKDQVIMSREMQWLRIDSYFRGDPTATSSDQLDAVHMPVTCVHCENAPCEQVCPVAATVHDTEGLNTMVYNRCIGTRYCSNNCPYKVRRFNYFDYHSKLDTDMFRNSGRAGGISNKPWLLMPDQQQNAQIDQIRRMVFNPDVTVRMRGVMEKCTYCTQRIARAKIDAKATWAKAKTANPDGDHAAYPMVEDGGVVTACEAACPTAAITFGNLNDPESRVSKLQNIKKSPRAYKLLEELNSRPRTKHMGLVRNPNPSSKAKVDAH